MVVSAIIEVTTYGSMLDAGLRSSKYPAIEKDNQWEFPLMRMTGSTFQTILEDLTPTSNEWVVTNSIEFLNHEMRCSQKQVNQSRNIWRLEVPKGMVFVHEKDYSVISSADMW